MSKRVRAAVVGVGYLGAFHAEKYANLDDVDLIGIIDADPLRAAEIAAARGSEVLPGLDALPGRVDCVSLAVPTSLHYRLARQLLESGIDVLVEKPMTETVAEGRELVDIAARTGRILQVGHLERFNPAIRALGDIVTQPRFIECHRLAPFVERGTDVDVILDLMIHDLDIILSIVRGEVVAIEAVGIPVLSESTDIANARLRFDNGCIANVTASRVTLKRERKLRLFQSDTYVSVDYSKKHIQVVRRRLVDGQPHVDVEELDLGAGDALFAEIEQFVDCVRTRHAPLVDGSAGLRALEVAHQIRACLESV